MVVLVLMYAFTQRLFPVAYEWGRLLKVIGSTAVLIAIGEVFVPDDGIAWLAVRLLLIAALPVALHITGFFSPEEQRYVKMIARPKELARKIQEARVQEKADTEQEGVRAQGLSEVYEVEQMNEDMRN